MFRPVDVTIRLNVDCAVALLASVTWNLAWKIPLVVGIPEILPFEASVRPGGKLPEDSLKLYDGAPLIAVKVDEYGCPTVPFGKGVGAIVSVEATILIDTGN